MYLYFMYLGILVIIQIVICDDIDDIILSLILSYISKFNQSFHAKTDTFVIIIIPLYILTCGKSHNFIPRYDIIQYSNDINWEMP